MLQTSVEAKRDRSRANVQSAEGQPIASSTMRTQASPQSHEASCDSFGTRELSTHAEAVLGADGAGFLFDLNDCFFAGCGFFAITLRRGDGLLFSLLGDCPLRVLVSGTGRLSLVIA